MNGYTITQAWQGYYGNVTGTIHLADAANNVMYNWSNMNPQGEVYASVANNIDWSQIECFNWTENGVALETNYGIEQDDVDGVNETFKDSNDHTEFYVANKKFSEGECMAVFLFENGQSVNQRFQEVLLSSGSNVVFASLLERDRIGFDNRPHDFQMIVLEDGHKDNIATTTYYFWVELD
ncbi:MAG: hypothetical protein QW273_02810 [Candidatus Pacearchaeota archaeon]